MCAIKKIISSWKNNGKQVFKFPSDIVLDLLELYRHYMDARMWCRLLKWASFRLGRFTGSDFAYECRLRFVPRCSRYGNKALNSFACWEWIYRIETGMVFYD